MAAFADIVPIKNFSMPTISMWLYFLGLIFIFFSKIIIQLFNDDMRQRERLQNGRDILLETLSRDDLPEDFRQQMDGNWKMLEGFTNNLLQMNTTSALSKWRAYFFFLSGMCFLVSSLFLIIAASTALSK